MLSDTGKFTKLDRQRSMARLDRKSYPTNEDFESIGDYYSKSHVREKTLLILEEKHQKTSKKVENLKELTYNKNGDGPKVGPEHMRKLTDLEKLEKEYGNAIKWLKGFHNQPEDLTREEAWGLKKQATNSNKRPEMVSVAHAMKDAMDVLKKEGKLEETTVEKQESSETTTAVGIDKTNDVIINVKEPIPSDSFSIDIDQIAESLNEIDINQDDIKKDNKEDTSSIIKAAIKDNPKLSSWIDKADDILKNCAKKYDDEYGTSQDPKARNNEIFKEALKALLDYAEDQGVEKNKCK